MQDEYFVVLKILIAIKSMQVCNLLCVLLRLIIITTAVFYCDLMLPFINTHYADVRLLWKSDQFTVSVFRNMENV